MILVIETEKVSNFSMQAKAFEALFNRLVYKVGPSRIHQYDGRRDGYSAIQENDHKPTDWYIIFFDRGKTPLSIRRAWDNRCILDGTGVTWLRKKTLDVFDSIGSLYIPKKKAKIGEVDRNEKVLG